MNERLGFYGKGVPLYVSIMECNGGRVRKQRQYKIIRKWCIETHRDYNLSHEFYCQLSFEAATGMYSGLYAKLGDYVFVSRQEGMTTHGMAVWELPFQSGIRIVWPLRDLRQTNDLWRSLKDLRISKWRIS